MQELTLGTKDKKTKVIFFFFKWVCYFSKQSQKEGESGGWEAVELTVPGIKPDMLKKLIKVVN